MNLYYYQYSSIYRHINTNYVRETFIDGIMDDNILFIRKFIVSDFNSIINYINNKRHLLLFVKMETLLFFI